jgi:hypothetical protein
MMMMPLTSRVEGEYSTVCLGQFRWRPTTIISVCYG